MNIFESDRQIILGSSSPRRQEMLEQLGIDFEICKPDILEKRKSGENPIDYVRRNCHEKAQWVQDHIKPDHSAIIITADTIVVQGDRVLEKPLDHNDAKVMLKSLSGSQHEVVSCFCVLSVDGQRNFETLHHEVTKVFFGDISDADIEFYVNTGEPMDKAGAYGIQGIGSFLIDRIEGSYSNVVGLPLLQLIQTIRHLEI